MLMRLPLLDRWYKAYLVRSAPTDLEHLLLFIGALIFPAVSAGYNHGVPQALKYLPDHFLGEYTWRPSVIACYSAGSFWRCARCDEIANDLGRVRYAQHSQPFLVPRIGGT
jgi:hypothetical protein